MYRNVVPYRPVTQSIAIAQPSEGANRAEKGNRRSDPGGSCLPSLNFDRFHQPCLFTDGAREATASARWGLSSPYHAQPLTLVYLDQSSPTNAPTRRYHSRMLIRPSLGTRAFSISPALYCKFNVPPDPRGPTAACSRLASGSLPPLPIARKYRFITM